MTDMRRIHLSVDGMTTACGRSLSAGGNVKPRATGSHWRSVWKHGYRVTTNFDEITCKLCRLRHSERRARSGWQPIETAPKHEEVLLLIGSRRRVVARLGDDGWRETFERRAVDYAGDPTCWMPLPEPP